MASLLATQILAHLSPSEWKAACIRLLPKVSETGSGTNLTRGIVDYYGFPVLTLDQDVWGISYAACKAYCSAADIGWRVPYVEFASSIGTYMLPWLALTVQLPFAAGSIKANLMSWCLALGSPPLMTFSLVITMLNRSYVRKAFASLKKMTEDQNYLHRLDAAECLLSHGQQVPLHIHNVKWFRSLVHLPENLSWWQHLPAILKETRRTVTPAFVAQYAFAVLAWALTLSVAIVSVLSDDGSRTEMSCSNLWVWLLPVVAGWMIVDTQYSHSGINDALKRENASLDITDDRQDDPGILGCSTPNDAVLVVAVTNKSDIGTVGLNDGTKEAEPQTPSTATTNKHLEQANIMPRRHVEGFPAQQGIMGGYACLDDCHSQVKDWPTGLIHMPTWIGCSIAGDHQQSGPAFNYSRVLTFPKLVQNFTQMFEGYVKHSQDERGNVDNVMKPKEVLSVDDIEFHREFHTYGPLSELAWDTWRNMAIAVITGLAVQWSTAGSSIIIAYFTAPQGLGCYSMYYIAYASISSVIMMMLFTSMFMSHAVMLNKQRTVLSRGRARKCWKTSAVAIAAILSRLTGKLLAVVNAVGLVVASILQLSDVGFSTCWCQAAVAARGESSYVPLKIASEEWRLSQKAWLGGVLMSIVVCIVIPVLFWFLARFRQVRW